MSVKWWLGGILAFVLFLIAKLPAEQVLGRLTMPAAISMHEIDGTFWRGSMARLSYNGLPLDNVTWQINPFALLIGNLSGDIKGGSMRDPESFAIDGPLSMPLFGFQPIKSDDLTVLLPTDLVLAQAQLPFPVNAGGRFRVQLDELNYGPTCTAMQGKGDWLNATVAGRQGPISLGTFSATLTCENEQIRMQVEEPNLLGLSFVSLVSTDFSKFSIQGKFKASDDLPTEVHQAARLFGSPGQDGYTSFRL